MFYLITTTKHQKVFVKHEFDTVAVRDMHWKRFFILKFVIFNRPDFCHSHSFVSNICEPLQEGKHVYPGGALQN